MLDKILRVIIGLFGILTGYSLVVLVKALGIITMELNGWLGLSIYIGASLLFGLIFLYLSSGIIDRIKRLMSFIENELQKFSIYDVVVSSIGLIIGLLIAHLISNPIYNLDISFIKFVIPTMIYLVLGYLGVTFPHKKKDDIQKFWTNLKKSSVETVGKVQGKSNKKAGVPKIIDTSAIIDGRILDVCRTEFVEGPLVIAEFVLQELQRIADSSDDLKRTKGRRGLDILQEIQKNLDIEVIIHDGDYSDIEEVDSKLLKLTKELDGKIVTTDYNLNKVAEVQGITVLNINDLANAVKPVVLPGEEMDVQVIKDGKEANQGLAYLDDGTMIVVESGKKYIGNNIEVVVTSVLQTSAGRMIFARPKSA